MLTFTSYVQGGIGEDGATFGETYILSLPSFQWTLVNHSAISCNPQMLTRSDISRTRHDSQHRTRQRLVILRRSPELADAHHRWLCRQYFLASMRCARVRRPTRPPAWTRERGGFATQAAMVVATLARVQRVSGPRQNHLIRWRQVRAPSISFDMYLLTR